MVLVDARICERATATLTVYVSVEFLLIANGLTRARSREPAVAGTVELLAVPLVEPVAVVTRVTIVPEQVPVVSFQVPPMQVSTVTWVVSRPVMV